MKTTVEIEPVLLRRAKQAALDRDTTLRALIEAGLRRELAVAGRAVGTMTPLPTASGDWPVGLDVSSREAMWDWLADAPGKAKRRR